MMAETYILQALQTGITSIRGNTAQLDNILTALNANEMAAAKAWFADTTKRIFVAPGFPMAPEQLPFIGITVADESQIESQTGIGLEYSTSVDGSGNIIDTRGARFQGTVKATIYTPNADLVVWLSTVCKWSLLTQYDWLGSDNGGGMNNITIRTGDYEPQPGFLPIFTFARGVFVTAEYDMIFVPATNIAPITSNTFSPSFTTYFTNKVV